MKVQIVVKQTGGGPTEYIFDVEIPALPDVGEHLQIRDDDRPGSGIEDFIVRSRQFGLAVRGIDKTDPSYKHDLISIEVEVAQSP